jgi:hypothetical protein
MTTKRRRKGWEPPLFEWSQLGPIPVEVKPALRNTDGAEADGLADVYGRKIELNADTPELAARIALVHEWLHVVFWDAGVRFPNEELEDVVMHFTATAIVAREDFHAAGGVPERPAGRDGKKKKPHI